MEKIAQLISVLYEEGGFIGGTLFFLAVSFVISYSLIKRRYNNVFICESLSGVYDDLIEQGKESLIGEVLVANGYIVLGHVFVALAKVAFALIYIYTLKTDALSFVDSSVLGFSIFRSGWEMIAAGGRDLIIAFAVIILELMSEIVMNRVIGDKCFVDSVILDLSVTLVPCILILILPIGYGLFLLAFTIVELIVTLVNIYLLKKSNMAGIKRSMDKFNANYRAKVLKEDESAPKVVKGKRQPSELHPSKKKKK